MDKESKSARKDLFFMAQQKKMVENITSMEEDFAQWYTDVVKKAELMDYSSVKGCMVIEPYGYAIWENIQTDPGRGALKRLGVQNVYMPMFIPESLLQKEKDHVEGFAPEVRLWSPRAAARSCTERLCVRPTSETLFCEHYQKIIHSYRDLPKLYNQWCSVVRWEKTTRPFLRSREFLWQEGHTMHETAQEAHGGHPAHAERLRGLLPRRTWPSRWSVGQKTDKEKFAGAEATYTIEAMMHDGKALQGGTSHYFGDGFAKAFDITFTDRENKLQHPHQTSWGVSTRMIGAIIMTHGDDNGLVLPPAIAPIQVVDRPGGHAQARRAWKRPRSCRSGCPRSSGPKLDAQRQLPRLEVCPVRDEGRAPAAGDRPQGHRAEPVRAGAPGQPGKAVCLSGRPGGRPSEGSLSARARRHVPAGPGEPRRKRPLTRHHL